MGQAGAGATPVGRVISKVGVTPATAAPLELRDNPDGSSTPWHEGHEVLDFDSGDPLVIPAGTSDADALKIVKGAKPFGKNSKYFAVVSETPAPSPEPAPAAPTPAPAPAAEEAPAIEPGGIVRVEPAKTEAKPEVAPPKETAPAALPDEKAFADDYAAFEGKTVEQPVQVEETGQTLKMRMDAATALRELDKRRKALEALKACLEKA